MQKSYVVLCLSGSYIASARTYRTDASKVVASVPTMRLARMVRDQMRLDARVREERRSQRIVGARRRAIVGPEAPPPAALTPASPLGDLVYRALVGGAQ